MKVEIWSDFTCPFCYIGKKNLGLAVERFEHKQFIQIEHKSYQLDQEADTYTNEDIYAVLKTNYGLSIEEVNKMIHEMLLQAEKVDVEINVQEISHFNTFHAHRLVKYAERKGKERELIDLLYDSYFKHMMNITDQNVLLSLAIKAGLDEEEADSLLCLNRYAKAVEEDEEIAKELGVSRIPFYIFNEQYALSGVQPIHVFTQVLQEIWEESEEQFRMKKKLGNKEKTYCVGDECNDS